MGLSKCRTYMYRLESLKNSNGAQILKKHYWQIIVVLIDRGVGTGETGEARASPEIRGCLKKNSQIGKKNNMSGILFFGCFT